MEAFYDKPLNEEHLINRINSGEKELYEILVRRNNQKLYRVIRSYIKETTEIEDIMQNTYLKAYEKLSQFKNTSKFSTWLIRIGINEALARLREKAKVNHVNQYEDQHHANSILEISGDSQLNPETKIIGDEAKRLLEHILDSLSPDYKVIYVMKEIEGLSIQNISEILDLSKSNVKVRLHRAKITMRAKLKLITKQQELFEFGNSRCDAITALVMKVCLSKNQGDQST